MSGWPQFQGDGAMSPGAQWMEPLFIHVTLVYPYADVRAAVSTAMPRLGAGTDVMAAPSERAALFRAARMAVWESCGDLDEFRRRNADAVDLMLTDAIDHLSGVPRDDAERAVRAFARLTVEEREVVRLLTVERLQPDELAWALDLDECAVGALLAAVRERLRTADTATDGQEVPDA